MDGPNQRSEESPGTTSGPLRIFKHGDRLFVVGFGLKLPVESEEEGRRLIVELEDEGYRICY